MGRIVSVKDSSRLVMCEVPYLKLQRLPDFIIYNMNGTLADKVKRDILDSGPNGLHHWLRRSLDTLIKQNKLASGGKLEQLWLEYLKVFAKQPTVNDAKTLRALNAFQVAAHLGASYVALPPAAHLAMFFERKADVKLPAASEAEIVSMRAEPNYGQGIKGRINDMVDYYQNTRFQVPSPSSSTQRRALMGQRSADHGHSESDTEETSGALAD
jgi:hypothetical protein